MSLKEIGNGTLSGKTDRHCATLWLDERELHTSSSRVMAQRCVDLSLFLSVFLSSLCVRERYLLVARGGRVILFSYIFEIGKKRVRRKPKKRADWLGKNLHMRIARVRLSFTTNTKRRLTTYKTCPPRVLFLFLPFCDRQQQPGLALASHQAVAAGQGAVDDATRKQDALSYLRHLKDRLKDRKQTYDEFLEIMKEFKAQR